MPSTHHVLIFDLDLKNNKKFCYQLKRHHYIHRVTALASISATIQRLDKLSSSSLPSSLLIVNCDCAFDGCLELFSHAAAKQPSLPVMVVTRAPQGENLVFAARAGATGFLLMDERPIVVFQAMQQMLSCGSYIHPTIVPTLLSAMTGFSLESQRISQLTRRESEILVYIAKGFTCTEIADLLTISSHTVSSHVKNLYRKLAIHSKGEAVVEAIRFGLIDVERAQAS